MLDAKRIKGTYETNKYVVEYSITGEGEKILILHGGHSNCMETFGFHALTQSGFQLITPSRAGYGVSTKAFLDEACSRYVSLLDHLNIEKVHIIGISAGGPSAIRLASSFPQRVRSLTLQSAVTGEWLTKEDTEFKAAHILFRPEMEGVTWKMVSTLSNLFPSLMFRQFFSSFSTLKWKEAQRLIRPADIEEFRKMINRQRSGEGFLMDIQQAEKISEADFTHIQCPVFVQTSKHDAAVAKRHAELVKNRITQSTLKIYDTWGHLIWLGENADLVSYDLVNFLQNVSTRSSFGEERKI